MVLASRLTSATQFGAQSLRQRDAALPHAVQHSPGLAEPVVEAVRTKLANGIERGDTVVEQPAKQQRGRRAKGEESITDCGALTSALLLSQRHELTWGDTS